MLTSVTNEILAGKQQTEKCKYSQRSVGVNVPPVPYLPCMQVIGTSMIKCRVYRKEKMHK
jgi:hypothetical protein